MESNYENSTGEYRLINIKCAPCDIDQCSKCIAEGMMDKLNGFSIDDAKVHCSCLAHDHRGVVPN